MGSCTKIYLETEPSQWYAWWIEFKKVGFCWKITLNNTEFPINYPLFTIRLFWRSKKIFQYFIGSLSKGSPMKSHFRRETLRWTPDPISPSEGPLYSRDSMLRDKEAVHIPKVPSCPGHSSSLILWLLVH